MLNVRFKGKRKEHEISDVITCSIIMKRTGWD
ncbi:hypothetical protein SA21321_1596, partial [Staphylococcus aureus subsp. aureus 21321]